MLPYLLPPPTPLIPLPFTSNGRGMHRFFTYITTLHKNQSSNVPDIIKM
jgi:hypothetical protein